MIGCGCGHRFAPLLGALEIAPHRRVGPGAPGPRALQRAAVPQGRRAGAAGDRGGAPSPRSLGRLVRRAAAAIDLDRPRAPLREIEAVLVDETCVRAGPRKGHHDGRERELKIAVALRRRGPARIELLGAQVAQAWDRLGPLLGSARGAAIAVTHGERGARAVVAAALPQVPQQICTFHVRRSLGHRLWQDGLELDGRTALARAIGNAIEYARSAEGAESALAAALAMAEGHAGGTPRSTCARSRRTSPPGCGSIPAERSRTRPRCSAHHARGQPPGRPGGCALVAQRRRGRRLGTPHAALRAPALASAMSGSRSHQSLGAAPLSQRNTSLSTA